MDVGALGEQDGRLTPMGVRLARLPVDVRIGKMLLLAGIFRCVQPVLSICASLGYKSPFLCPLGQEAEANAKMLTRLGLTG